MPDGIKAILIQVYKEEGENDLSIKYSELKSNGNVESDPKNFKYLKADADGNLVLDGEKFYSVQNESIETGKGSLAINKKDNNGKPLQGAEFTLTNDAGEVVKKVTSDASGKVVFLGLEPGNYRLSETKAPDGYQKTNEIWSVYVASDGKTFVNAVGQIAPNPGENEGANVTSKVTLDTTNSNIDFNDTAIDGIPGNGRLEMDTGENNITVKMKMSIDSANPGDYFIINESDTLHYNMLQPDKPNYNNITDADGTVIARWAFGPNFNMDKGTGKDIYFIFTDAVRGKKNISMNLKWSHSVNTNIASKSGTYTFKASLGSKAVSKDIEIAYMPHVTNDSKTLSINTNYLYTNDQNGKYTQIGYINPKAQNITGDSTIRVYPAVDDRFFNMANNIDATKTKVSLYKLKEGTKVQDTAVFNPDELELVRSDKYDLTYEGKTENGELVNAVEIKPKEDIGENVYLIKVDSEMVYPNKNDNGEYPPVMLAQYIELENANATPLVRESNAIQTSISNASGHADEDYTPPVFDVTNDIHINKKGRLEITKTDENEFASLPGAEFTLSPTNPKGEDIVKSSDSLGKVSFEDLDPGTYELKETKAPNGYINSDKTWTVIVDENGVTTIDEVKGIADNARLFSSNVSNKLKAMKPSFNIGESLSNLKLFSAAGTGTFDEKFKSTIGGTLSPTEPNFGKTTISSKVTPIVDLNGKNVNGQYQIDLDIKAGKDNESGSNNNIVVIVPIVSFLSDEEFSAYKKALSDWIGNYENTNTKAAVISYYYKTAPNGGAVANKETSGLTDIATAKQAINNLTKLSNGSTYGGLELAFYNAKEILNKAEVSGNAYIVNATNSDQFQTDIINSYISNVLDNQNINKLAVYNFSLGPNKSEVERLYKMLKNSVTVAGSNDSNSYNLPQLITSIPDIRNAIFNVSFNNNFTFVGSSTETYKKNVHGEVITNSKWHKSHNDNTNTIDLNEGELTLNAGETAHMSFKVQAKDGITAGEYNLINSIAFKPNADAQDYNIPSPTVTLSDPIEKMNITIESRHSDTSETQGTIKFALKRSLNGIEDTDFVKYIGQSIPINNSVTYSVDKTDANKVPYKYYLEGESIEGNEKIVLGKVTSETSTDGLTFIIPSSLKSQFMVNLNWNGLKPLNSAVKVSVIDANEKRQTLTFDKNSSLVQTIDNVAKPVKVESVEGLPQGYTCSASSVSQDENSLTVTITKSDEPTNLNVRNKKAPTGSFEILKTNEDGSKKLVGAKFELTSNLEGFKPIEMISDSNGIVSFKDLMPGDYTLKEIQAPNGYEPSDKTWYISVDDTGKTIVKEVVKGSQETVVNDTLNNPTYARRIWAGDGSLVVDFYNGIAEENGKYYLYVYYTKLANNSNWEDVINIQFNTNDFTVKRDGSEITGVYEYFYPYHNYKYQDNNGRYYDYGYYKFEISLKNNTFDGESRTLSPIKSFNYENTTIENEYFPTITQTKSLITVPDDSVLVETSGENNQFQVKNAAKPKGKIALHKEDGLNGESLEGVEFSLIKVNENNEPLEGEEAVIKTTDKNGDIAFTDLEDGRYKLTETKQIDGYNKMLVDFIVAVKDGKASYTRIKKVEEQSQLAKVGPTKEVNYKLEFLPKSEEVPNYKVDLYADQGDGSVLQSLENNPRGNFTVKDDTRNYYVKLNLGDKQDEWYLTYLKTDNNTIQVIAYKTDAYEDVGEDPIQIRNFPEDVGKANLKITKKDVENGGSLSGVKFHVASSNGYSKDFLTDGNGEINIENLPNGIYEVTEISAPPGYKVDKTPKRIIIGGNYKVPENVEGKNVTSMVHYDGTPELHVSDEYGDSLYPKLVKPNDSEAFNLTSKYRFDKGATEEENIKPGDYFFVELSNNINTWGIYPPKHSYDLNLAGPVGLLAKGEFVKDYDKNGHNALKYTFTDYVANQYPETASSTISYFIEENIVKDNARIGVYTKLNGQTNNYTLDVYYTPETYNGYTGFLPANSINRLVEVDWTTGTYRTIIYVNRYGYGLDRSKLDFGHDYRNGGNNPLIQISNEDRVSVYKAKPGVDVDDSMPKSFGIYSKTDPDKAIDSDNLSYVYGYSYNPYNPNSAYNKNNRVYIDNNRWYVNFGSDMADGDSYVVVIDGHFDNTRNSERLWFRQHLNVGRYYDYEYGWQYRNIVATSATFNDPYSNETSSDGNFGLKVFNEKNKIEYTKMMGKIVGEVPEDKPTDEIPEGPNKAPVKPNLPMGAENVDGVLPGAEFELRVKNDQGDFVYVTDSKRTSGEDGKFSWEGLPQGEYQVWETKAPDGYELPKDFVSSFVVTADGIITGITENDLIIINDKKHPMDFKLQKIWQKEEDGKLTEELINAGTLELKLQAPSDKKFPDTVASQEKTPENSYYRIKEVAEDKSYILIEVDLEKASNAEVHKTGIQIDVPSDWPSGIYTMTETKAPVGYRKTDKEYKIGISFDSRTITWNNEGKEVLIYSDENSTGTNINQTLGILQIVNEKGLFPSTGGLGTLLFTVIGLTAMAVAFVGYRRKRVSDDE
ncbi:SpaA isopeptide-forming pilin-related protein [Peptoniphilus sp.]|jgi:LPXTG-motif cell wall-anchored protein|uniref:SpaA isopeptide-forming pilin-related protein n=1 Tax=Peptoniphilus sp. TaxID=1971214 RepID=UPI003D8D15FB